MNLPGHLQATYEQTKQAINQQLGDVRAVAVEYDKNKYYCWFYLAVVGPDDNVMYGCIDATLQKPAFENTVALTKLVELGPDSLRVFDWDPFRVLEREAPAMVKNQWTLCRWHAKPIGVGDFTFTEPNANARYSGVVDYDTHRLKLLNEAKDKALREIKRSPKVMTWPVCGNGGTVDVTWLDNLVGVVASHTAVWWCNCRRLV